MRFTARKTSRNALFGTERRLVTRIVTRGNGDRDVSDSTAGRKDLSFDIRSAIGTTTCGKSGDE